MYVCGHLSVSLCYTKEMCTFSLSLQDNNMIRERAASAGCTWDMMSLHKFHRSSRIRSQISPQEMSRSWIYLFRGCVGRNSFSGSANTPQSGTSSVGSQLVLFLGKLKEYNKGRKEEKPHGALNNLTSTVYSSFKGLVKI